MSNINEKLDGMEQPVITAAADGNLKNRKKSSYFRKKSRVGYLFAMPWLVGLFVFTLLPIIATLVLSFTRYNMINPPSWIGLVNYRVMFSLDPAFWRSLYNTSYYVLGSVFLKVFISMIFAVLLNHTYRGMRLLKTVYFLPCILPGVPVLLLWKMMFNPSSGIINQFLRFFGLNGPTWLHSPVWSKPAIVIMSLWGIGGTIVIFLAGLQDIPGHLYEAADIDGASALAKFRNITVPLLVPVILFNVVTGIIHASQVFTEAFVLTGGGPMESTMFLNLRIYLFAFKEGQMGYSSAMAWIMFIILVPITAIIFKASKRWLDY